MRAVKNSAKWKNANHEAECGHGVDMATIYMVVTVAGLQCSRVCHQWRACNVAGCVTSGGPAM